jgi:hypothetical protein
VPIAPLFQSACDLAERIPDLVADFLELENKTSRRFREDSVTDIVIASLLRIAGGNATVLTPPEVKTGGDFDILIVDPSTRDAVQYRIQAKRLVPHANHWDWSSYRELDHPHGTGRQSSTLVRSSAHEAVHTIPLYAFYNPQTICAASDGVVSGIDLADGVQINEIVKALVKAKASSRRPRWKRVEYLRGLFFPLSTILCPPAPTSAPRQIVAPSDSREAAESAMSLRRAERLLEEALPLEYRAADQPRVLPPQAVRETFSRPRRGRRQFPRVVERALGRQPDDPPILVSSMVRRPKLILLSRLG